MKTTALPSPGGKDRLSPIYPHLILLQREEVLGAWQRHHKLHTRLYFLEPYHKRKDIASVRGDVAFATPAQLTPTLNLHMCTCTFNTCTCTFNNKKEVSIHDMWNQPNELPSIAIHTNVLNHDKPIHFL